jgi:hypothetical protein
MEHLPKDTLKDIIFDAFARLAKMVEILHRLLRWACLNCWLMTCLNILIVLWYWSSCGLRYCLKRILLFTVVQHICWCSFFICFSNCRSHVKILRVIKVWIGLHFCITLFWTACLPYRGSW